MISVDFSISSEQIVLGGILLDDLQAYVNVIGVLNSADFYRGDHRLIFTAITKLADDLQSLDAITVAEFLEQEDNLFDCGGLRYLAKLSMETASSANIAWHAERVAECAKRRRIREAAARVADGDLDALALLIAVAA